MSSVLRMLRPNLKRLRKTLVWLQEQETLPDGFGFDLWYWRKESSCGTLMCLAGWYVEQNPDCGLVFAQELLNTYYLRPGDWTEEQMQGTRLGEILADHFGIPRRISRELFTADGYLDLESTDRKLVAQRCLERVDWLLEQADRLPAITDDALLTGWDLFRDKQDRQHAQEV